MLHSSLRHCAGAPRGMKDGALAQLVERLLCKQDVNGSNPLGSTISNMIRKHSLFFLVLLGRAHDTGHAFTSFREIIGVIGRTRVGVRWWPVQQWIGSQQ